MKSAKKRRRRKDACTKKEKAAKQRAYYKKNRVKIVGKAIAWRAANPGRYLKARRRATFGEFANDHYNECMKSQNGFCAICGTLMRKPCQDHCHLTGKMRALLCERCNRGLGQFGDNPIILAKAEAYLVQWYEINRVRSDDGWMPRTISSVVRQ